MTRLVMGIDPSTSSTGWAVIEVTDKLSLLKYGTIKPKSSLKAHQKLKFIYDNLYHICNELGYCPDVLVIEDQYFRFADATKAVLRVRGIVELFAATQEMELHLLYPVTVKKEFAGSGKATKQQVIDAVKDIYNVEVNTDDEADAIAIAHMMGKEVLANLIDKGES